MKELLSKVDHTLLSVGCTWDEIKMTCDEALEYATASVCIPPCFVKRAKEYLESSSVKVCTVIGFPNGYSTTEAKVFETKTALVDGADEIDTVINVSDVKEGNFDKVLDELTQIKKACEEFSGCSKKVLKVIIEACLLTEQEKIKMCHIVSQSGADFIKTSTGFSKHGATKEDVALLKANVLPNVKVKAAGGISSIEDAKAFIELGADRLGTSKVVKILKNQTVKGDY